jgi:hypothetical protein
VIGHGFFGYDGLVSSVRCRYSLFDVPAVSLQDDEIGCDVSPRTILENSTDGGATSDGDVHNGEAEAHATLQVPASPGAIYTWADSLMTTVQSETYLSPLQVAINTLDFRGDLLFKFYHQVLASVKCSNSSEWKLPFGGSPEGGYPVTLIGTGFDGFDANPTTVRIRFATRSNRGNSSFYEVGAVSLSGTEVVVHAPKASLEEGDLLTQRTFPCWLPPCRRVILTLALNGVDFVGGYKDVEFVFLVDPWRFLNLLGRELLSMSVLLAIIAAANLVATWRYQRIVYAQYLLLKRQILSSTVWQSSMGNPTERGEEGQS